MKNLQRKFKRKSIILILFTIVMLTFLYWLSTYNSLNNGELILYKALTQHKRKDLKYEYQYVTVVENNNIPQVLDNYHALITGIKSIQLSGKYLGETETLLQIGCTVYKLSDEAWYSIGESFSDYIVILPYQILELIENVDQVDRVTSDTEYILYTRLGTSPYFLDMFWDKVLCSLWINKSSFQLNRIEIRGSKGVDCTVNLFIIYKDFSYI